MLIKMKNLACIKALIFILFNAVNAEPYLLEPNDRKFVSDYFTYAEVRELLLVGCSAEETFHLAKWLTLTTNIWLHLPSINDDYVAKQTYHKYGVFVNHKCALGQNWLIKNSERHFLNTSYHWLIWGCESVMQKVTISLNLSVDSELVWSYKNISTGMIILHDIYKINYTWPIIVTPAGVWYNNTGLLYNLTAYKYERRRNMQGLVFRAGLALNNVPYDNVEEELIKPEYREKDSMATFNYAVYLFLMKQFNFSVKLTLTSLFGYVVENGRYEGLVKLIGDGDVDVHVSGLFISPMRYKHMDYTVNTWKFRSGFIFRHPPVTDGFDALIQPFSYSLWACASLTWIFIMGMLRFSSRVHHREFQNREFSKDEDEMTWSDAFIAIMSTVGQQGIAKQSTWVSWKMIFFVLLIVTLFIDTYYASSIVFSLITEPKRTIRTTRDLMDSDLKVGAENISYNVALFEVNDDPLIRKLFKRKMLHSKDSKPEYYTLENGVKKVLHEPFAFHVELLKIYKTIDKIFPEDSKCSLTEIVAFTPEYTFIPVRWKSPYKEIITLGLRRATEFGLLNYLNRLWRPDLPTCFLPGSEVVPVGPHTVLPAFGILLVGIFIALVILQIERLQHAM